MSDAIKIVVSDCHLGKGRFLPGGTPNLMEDFHQDHKFAEMLRYYSHGEGRKGADAVELVINGDFFDYLTVDVSGKYPDAMFEDDAVLTTELICKGHPIVIEALREFAQTQGCSIRYLMGNHDPAIVWPKVQQKLESLIGVPIIFGLGSYRFDDVHIEHGHQHDVSNEFDMEHLVLPAGLRARKEAVINFPFGCFFVTQFLTQLRAKRPYMGKVVPFRLYLRWAFINDFWFALWHGFMVVLFFIKMRFIRHPLRFMRLGKTLKILRNTFWPIRLERVAKKMLEEADYRVLLMGHNHEACVRLHPNEKQYINSGTWTEFTSFDPERMGYNMILSYILLEKNGDQPWLAELKRWTGRHRVEETLY